MGTWDLPLWVGLPLFVLLFLAGSWLILLAMRRWVDRASKGSPEWDRVLEYAMAAYGVLYGVTLAMIAAGAYENNRDVDQIVLRESSAVAVLYRDAVGFTEPERSELQQQLREYVLQVIEVDWPLQETGVPPEETIDEVDRIQDVIMTYEAQEPSEVVKLSQTVAAFNQFVYDRRARIAITQLHLPWVLWVVMVVGAFLNAVLIGLIQVRSLRVHLIMSGLIAVYVSLLIYTIASFDNPYSGAVVVGPEYFEELLVGLMRDTG